MSTQRQDDPGLDRLLRPALVSAQNTGGEDCPDADRVAAYGDGLLSARERTDLEPHLSSCARCQAILAVLAQESEAELPVVEGKPSAWRAFLTLPSLRWLVPAGAAALGVVLYVAVQQGPDSDTDLATPPAVAAPEMTMAERAAVPSRPEERAKSATPEPSRTTEGLTSPATVSARPKAPVTAKPTELSARTSVDVVAAAPPAARPDAQPAALAVLDRPRQESAPRVDAPRQTDFATATAERKAVSELGRGQAMSPQAAARADTAQTQRGQTKRVVTVDVANVVPAGGLEGLWKESSFVVLARALATRPPVLGTQKAGSGIVTVGPLLPTEFEVLEVFKRHAEITPADRFVVSQIGGEASDEMAIYRASTWVPLQAGSEYVLFLLRTPGADDPDRLGVLGVSVGIYRLDGDRVMIGLNPAPDPSLSRAALLARLRQLAGTAAR